MRCWATIALLIAASVPGQGASETVRGVTISTHGGGRDWGTDDIVPTMREIREVGANWVAIHPYAGIRENGAVRTRDLSLDDPPEYVVRPIREAHALGLKIVIKPHIAYWGTRFSWRGEIEFDNDEKWRRFWSEYRDWILALARMCPDADAFVIGTELDRTLGHEQRWRELIRDVREITDAPLTYAANWTDYQRVPFWDALDVIGIQAYFPLTNEPDPETSVLVRAWEHRMRELRTYAESQSRNIVFTEIGYNRSRLAPVQPWDSRTDGPDPLPIQLTCMRVALEAIEREPTVVGSFLWKWFTWPNRQGGNFRVDTPEMRAVISSAWK